jgi:hypothetical protein
MEGWPRPPVQNVDGCSPYLTQGALVGGGGADIGILAYKPADKRQGHDFMSAAYRFHMERRYHLIVSASISCCQM